MFSRESVCEDEGKRMLAGHWKNDRSKTMTSRTLNPDDIFLFEDQLGKEEKQTMNSAREYAQSKLEPRALEGNQSGIFHDEIPQEMGQMGLLGATISETYGGGGKSQISYGLIARELERVDSGYRSFVSVQSSLVMYPIEQFGTDDQRNNFLPGLATGDLIGCFALTEPDHGSDPGSMTSTAERVTGGWVLNGRKRWVTNSPIADVAVVWVKTRESGTEKPVIRGFLLERGMDGFRAPSIDNKMSLRVSVSGEIEMSDVFVPDDNLLPGARGLKSALACLTSARYGISWGTIGAAENCYQRARDYVLNREQFGQPLAATQLIQTKLADMATEITKMQLIAYRLGDLYDSGQLVPEMVSLAKRTNSNSALRIARDARDMLGANGITGEYRVIHHMVNLESVNTYEGTYDIHGLILGKALTGIQSFVPRG
ncbi:MAG: acyl-CoA dehydrogenase [Rhodothermia bacterium]|nr:MAG: acyl-CoA dehydrogenase [Rhodothermia bacterium]